MFQRKRRKDEVGLDVPDEDFILRLVSPDYFESWRNARAENAQILQPFEPIWGADALSELRYRDMAREARRSYRNATGAMMLLVHRETDEVMGGINLSNIRRRAAEMATIGYWLSRRWGGQGRMTAAVRRMVDFAFYDFRLHRVEAGCIPENDASARVLLGAGFEEEGYARKYLRINGRWQDHRLFAIVREEDEL